MELLAPFSRHLQSMNIFKVNQHYKIHGLEFRERIFTQRQHSPAAVELFISEALSKLWVTWPEVDESGVMTLWRLSWPPATELFSDTSTPAVRCSKDSMATISNPKSTGNAHKVT